MKTDPVYQRLVTQWRERAVELHKHATGDPWEAGEHLALNMCADALEAALASPPPDEPPPVISNIHLMAKVAEQADEIAEMKEDHAISRDVLLADLKISGNRNMELEIENQRLKRQLDDQRPAPPDEPEARRRPEPGTDGDMRQEIEDLRCVLNLIEELSRSPELMRHDAAIAHLQAIWKLAAPPGHPRG